MPESSCRSPQQNHYYRQKRLVMFPDMPLLGKTPTIFSQHYDVQLRRLSMAFFNSAITVLQTLVIALGAGLGIWGAINLLEGYGNDNPGANACV